MFERRSKFIALRSLSMEQAPTYCHIVQKIQKMRHCSHSGSRRIYVGTGKRSLFSSDDALDMRLPIFLTKSNPSELYTPLVSIARGTNSCVCDRAAYFCFLSVAACSAAAPGRQKVDAMCEVANVSGTVTSHVRHRPLAHERLLINIINIIVIIIFLALLRSRPGHALNCDIVNIDVIFIPRLQF